MRRACELCGYNGSNGMHHGKRTVCMVCRDKLLEFAVTAGMKFEMEERQ